MMAETATGLRADIKLLLLFLAGNRVVVRCMAPKLTQVALPSRWYHVAITHSTGSALSSSMLRMFVDGNLEASSRFKYAKVCGPAWSCSLWNFPLLGT